MAEQPDVGRVADQEPKTTRYAIAAMPVAFQTVRWCWPSARPRIESMMPALSICQPAATSGSTATFQRRDSTDPNAQQNDEPSSATQATSCIQPSRSAAATFGQNRTATPRRRARRRRWRSAWPGRGREEPAFDEQEPDGDDGDDERGEPGRDLELGPGDGRPDGGGAEGPRDKGVDA